mgnify:CR=1 FL=1
MNKKPLQEIMWDGYCSHYIKTKLLKIKIGIILLLSFQITNIYAQNSLRLYMVGNSVTDGINYAGLQAIAQSQGKTHTWARHMIPGAPLGWLWENQNSGFTETPYGNPTNAFPNYDWDAISLQPFDRHIEGAGNDKEIINNYINLAKGRSPNVQFYIYMRYPRTSDNKQPTDPTLTADTWTALWQRTFTGSWDGAEESKDFFQKLLVAVRGYSVINKPILIIPVGEVFNNLNTKMKNGQVPGYSKIWQVYSDGIHMNNVGSYIAALTFYSTLYKADPRGSAVPSQYGSIPSNVVTQIQNSVWEVVSTYQYSGVSSSTIAVTGVTVSPTSVTLNNGQTSQLTATVLPANATNKTVTWSSSNNLIASVNSSGLVTANGAGTATVTATTADGSFTATASITVNASGGGGGSTAGVLAAWEFAGSGGQNNLAATSKMTQISSATASIAAGLTPINYLSNGLTATNSNATSLSAAISGNKYFSFTVNPASGQNYTVDKIEIIPVSQGFTRTFSLLSSRNGFTTSNVIAVYTANAEFNGSKITLNISGHTNLTTSTEFRVYVHSTSTNIYESVGIGNGTGDDFIISGSVGGGADTQAPTAPTNLAAATVRASTLTLSWTNATDNVGVTGYDVFRGATKLNTSLLTTNTYNVTGLTACTDYSFTVRAYDAAGNNTTSAALAVKSNCAPTAVLNATPTSGSAPLAVNFNATGSTDPDAGDFILGYEWDFGDGSAISNANAPSHTYNATGTYTARLRVMDNRDLYSAQVTRIITVGSAPTLRNPENPSNTTAGLDYKYFEGTWSLLPDFGALSPVKSGNVAGFDISPRNRDDQFGMQFNGFINVPTDGDYTFFTSSDDGSKLFIGTTQVVDNDGLHGIQERSGVIGLKAGRHAISVTFFENGGGQDLSVSYSGPGITKQVIPASALFRINPVVTGSVVRETWTGISGTSVSLIPTSTAPNSTANLTSLEIPVNNADNYGTRIRGYIIPSTSGSYTFYVSGDDDVQLWLSTNSDPATRAKIAEVVGWTNSREWNKYASQTSTARSLTAGTQYHFEVLHKEGGGGDNLAVGWTGPGISTISVIGGSNIAPFGGGTTPPPTDTQAPSVPSGLTASNIAQTGFTLTWTASTDNVGVTQYEVYRNGTLNNTSSNTSSNITGLTAATTYSFTVRARDAAGNWSAQSSALSVTTSAATTTTRKYDIGVNIDFVGDYTSAKPFADAMRQHRHWGSATLDANFWPTQDGTVLVYHGLNTGDNHGTYKLYFNGQATVTSGEATISNMVYNSTTNRSTADLVISQSTNSQLFINFTNTKRTSASATNTGVTNVKLMRPTFPGSTTAYAEDKIYTDQFIAALAPFSTLRTMDWSSTNSSEEQDWADRTLWTHARQIPPSTNGKVYGWQGRPASWESIIMLANISNKDVWICVPHKATDDYVRQLARLFRDGNAHTAPLNSNLKLYVEYSNEVWNWAGAFQQTGEVRDLALAKGFPLNFDGVTDENKLWMRYKGLRTVEISNIFRQEFGNAQMMTRVRPLLMHQVGQPYQQSHVLQFIDRYYNKTDSRSNWTDPHPVNYYIYGGSGSTYFSPENGVNATTIWNSKEFDSWGYWINNNVGPDAVWAKMYGLEQISYEGNVHSTGDAATDAVIAQVDVTQQMSDEIVEHFQAWSSVGGGQWNFFSIMDWYGAIKGSNTNTSYHKFQTLTQLKNTDAYPVSYGRTVPFTADGNAYHQHSTGWRQPGTGTLDLSTGGEGSDYAAAYAFHVTTDGNRTVEVEYSTTGNAALQITLEGNERQKLNLSSTGGSIATTSFVVNLVRDKLYALRLAALSGTVKIHRVKVLSGGSREELTENTNRVSIYPNPSTTGEFTVAGSFDDNSTVYLTDVLGNVIQTGKAAAGKVHFQNLSSGMYILSIPSLNGNKNHKVIVE